MDNNTPHVSYQDDLSQRNLEKKTCCSKENATNKTTPAHVTLHKKNRNEEIRIRVHLVALQQNVSTQKQNIRLMRRSVSEITTA
jgi:hypothetical protein